MAESLEEQQPLLPGSRGYAVLITNKNFLPLKCFMATYPGMLIQDPTRHGADEDDNNLQYIFDRRLKFQLLEKRTYKDVNKDPYKRSEQPFWIHESPPEDKTKCKCISCKIQTKDHSQSECFVLAISTHGVQVDREQKICFSDDFHVGCERVTLSDIIETLNDENCKTLKGKPRIILLQLCRSDPDVHKDKQDGVWHDKGHLVDVNEPDERTFENLTISGKDESIKAGGDCNNKEETEEIEDTEMHVFDTELIGPEKEEEEEEDDESKSQDYFYGIERALQNLPSDFLIVFPAVSGKKAVHNFNYGSWLIHELRNVVEDYKFDENPNMNFLTVLTNAAGKVAREKEGKQGQKTAVCIVHRLLRPLIFKDIQDTGQGQPNLMIDKPAPFFAPPREST